MKALSFSKYAAVAAIAMLCGIVTLSAPSVRACPAGNDYLPSGEPTTGWIGDIYTVYTIPGTTCQIRVMSCYRVFPDGTEQVIIETVEPNWNHTDCDAIPGDVLIKQAATLLFNDPYVMCTLAGIVDCSKGFTTTTTLTFSYCWQYNGVGLPNPITGGYSSYAYNYCNVDNNGMTCEKTCQACCDNGVVTYSGCVSATVGTVSCATPPTPPAPWTLGVCYDIEPCS